MGRTVNGSWTAMVEPGGAARVKTQTRILGKREIRVRLTRGQVPTAPILEELERAGYNPNHLTTPRMVYRWRVLGYMAFGSADRVMTAASLALRWHSPELRDLYFGVNLDRYHNAPPEDNYKFHGDTSKWETGCRCTPCETAAYDIMRRRKERVEGKP